MTGARSRHTDALDRFLNQAADDLAQSDKQPLDDSEGLLFLGSWHQSYPAILVQDPFLTDSALRQFLFLMQESSRNPHGAIAMPSLESFAERYDYARKTAGRDRMLLRICRWISLHQQVRDAQGRFKGSIYAIHSEPCSLNEANRLDASYLALLEEGKDHSDRFVRRAAQAALAGIDQAIEEGRDPLESPDPVGRRLDAAEAVRSGGGSFFELLIGGGSPEPTESASANPEASLEKFTHGKPGVNSTHGDSEPWVKSTHRDQVTDLDDEYHFPDSLVKFTHGPTCSSSSNTTTTDKTGARNAENRSLNAGHSVANDKSADSSVESPPTQALRWPDGITPNDQHLIHRVFDKHAIPGAQRQEVVDVLAHKLHDAENPLRNSVSYAVTLCKRVASGTFQPVSPPSSRTTATDPSPNHDPSRTRLLDLRREIRHVQSEIDGMEQNLIPLARAEARPELEASRDRLCEQRDDLKQQYRQLKTSIEGSGDRRQPTTH